MKKLELIVVQEKHSISHDVYLNIHKENGNIEKFCIRRDISKTETKEIINKLNQKGPINITKEKDRDYISLGIEKESQDIILERLA